MANVLLISPRLFGYETRIQDAMIQLGHTVHWQDERLGNGFWDKTLTRFGLMHLFKSRIAGFVSELKGVIDQRDIDTVVIVCPETLRGVELAALKAHKPSLKIVAYAWDTQTQKPIDDKTHQVVDVAYSFDLEDCEKDSRLVHMPLFHSVDVPAPKEVTSDKTYDFSFIGSGRMRRIVVLAELEKAVERAGKNAYFYIYAQSYPHYLFFRLLQWKTGYKGQISREKVGYTTYLDVAQNSACVVDIEFAAQSGLTMRTIETVFARRPLLTTNAIAERYDFAAHGGIAILNEGNISVEDMDLATPDWPDTMFEAYHLRNWSKNLVECVKDISYTRKTKDRPSA